MIRTAQPRDLARILEIYDYARGFMERTGTPASGGSTFPRRSSCVRTSVRSVSS